jgi:hypothetical protein
MFAELPVEVQRQARRAYRTFRDNPKHPSLRFKAIHPTRPIYSARISSDADPNERFEKDAADRASHPRRLTVQLN